MPRIPTLAGAVLLCAALPGLARAEMAGADTARLTLLQQQGRARAAAWLAAGHARAAAAPQITAGKILNSAVTVGQFPGTPGLQFTYTAPGYFNYAYLQFQSPNGAQYYYTEYGYPPPVAKAGTIDYEQNAQPFSLYAEAGTWTLQSGGICDLNYSCTYYSASQLAALFAGGTSVAVTNPGTQDTTPPVLSAGSITTPKVSASAAYPFFTLKLSVSDTPSGVEQVNVVVTQPDGVAWPETYVDLPRPVASGTIFGGVALSASAPLGTWTVSTVQICDLAVNCTTVSGAEAITALLGGDSFTVTK